MRVTAPGCSARMNRCVCSPPGAWEGMGEKVRKGTGTCVEVSSGKDVVV